MPGATTAECANDSGTSLRHHRRDERLDGQGGTGHAHRKCPSWRAADFHDHLDDGVETAFGEGLALPVRACALLQQTVDE